MRWSCALLFLPVLCCGFVTASSARADVAPAATPVPLEVLVTILPHADLVERLGGDAVRVHVLVGRNQSPETYQPSPRELQQLAGSQVWLTTGTPIETALRSRLLTMLPDLQIVPTHAELEVLADHHCAHHDHDHDHGDMDPHVWVSARNTAVQAAVMAAVLQERLPDHAERIAATLAEVQAELAAIDRDLAALLAPVQSRTFYVFHPAFGYFARDYDLRQEAVESGGQAPSPRRLATLMNSIKAAGARVIYVQPQHSVQSAQAVAREAGLEVVVLDPLDRDHLANLRRIGELIHAGLEPLP
jgi:zinc transport system substrate-binding protein